MKKGLYGFTALVMALTLVGCGADKEKASDNDSKSSKTTTVADEKKNSKKSDKSVDDVKVDTSAPDIKTYAGEYVTRGYGLWEDYPDELDPKKLEKTLEDDHMTISEDGTLHFCGKDYKLVPEGTKDGSHVYSVDGSTFDFKNFCKPAKNMFSTPKCVDKDYEGVVYFIDEALPMTVNDEEVPYNEFRVYITAKGDESCSECISFKLQGDDDADWTFTFDDWDDLEDSDEDDWSFSFGDSEDEDTEDNNKEIEYRSLS